MDSEVLKTVSLTKIYKNGDTLLKAVDDISISVKEQEFVAIAGPSGSGKSTLLNLLSGLEYPTHGCIYINDVNITDFTEEERTIFRRNHIGFVFQSYNLVPALNVFENIILPSKLIGREINEQEVLELTGQLGIEQKLFCMPGTLSGGQQQRVAIARALFTKPSIILADEPTGNLDSKSKQSVISLMKEMSRIYRQTCVVVTHDEQIADLADRVIRLEDGRVSEQ